MGQEKFILLMSNISAALVAKIGERQKVSDAEALERLYSSKLYSILEQEDTKVWQYSTEMLYSLFEQEIQSGVLKFPDI